MAAYVTVQEYKDYMMSMNNQSSQLLPKAADDTFLGTLLDTATAYIDSETKRKFAAVTQTRSFLQNAVVWNDPQLLLVDRDLLSVTTITNGDGTTIGPSDLRLEPLNIVPAYGIRLKTTKSWVFASDAVVAVTGSWGFSTTPPADVKHMTCRVAYVLQSRRMATSNVEMVSSGGQLGQSYKYGSQMPDDVKGWLTRYTRKHYG